jgi:endonuclease-3
MASRKQSVARTRKKTAAKKPAAKRPAPPPKAKPRKPSAPGADAIGERLALAIPAPRCELAFRDGFQLLIATILSAQSTDKAVNAVTPALFERYPTPAALAGAALEELEVMIKRTGFFRAKSKSIRGAAQKLVDDFGGEVPRALEQLTTLPGVARKTANVVLGTAYGIASGFVVDTHIARVSQRLQLTRESEPAKIEQDLCALFPRTQWVDMGHRILLHGRYTCLARAPKCAECPLNELCPSRLAKPGEPDWKERATAEAQRVDQGMAA